MILGSKENIEINIREVYRYLGYKNELPSSEVAEKINRGIEDVYEASEFRSFKQRFPLSEGLDLLYIDDKVIRSRDLAKNLNGCDEVFLFGATIGVGTDRLIARASVNNMLSAAVYQAVGAALIEAYCDSINMEIDSMVREEGKSTRPRFSPGYGDFTLDYQEMIFELLNLTKHTGISMTESKLMIPSKSVTAIIGVKPGTDGCIKLTHDCTNCDLIDCQFRI